jgi:hypothetical protein
MQSTVTFGFLLLSSSLVISSSKPTVIKRERREYSIYGGSSKELWLGVAFDEFVCRSQHFLTVTDAPPAWWPGQQARQCSDCLHAASEQSGGRRSSHSDQSPHRNRHTKETNGKIYSRVKIGKDNGFGFLVLDPTAHSFRLCGWGRPETRTWSSVFLFFLLLATLTHTAGSRGRDSMIYRAAHRFLRIVIVRPHGARHNSKSIYCTVCANHEAEVAHLIYFK